MFVINLGSVIYQLVGEDDESEVYYGLDVDAQGRFGVDRRSGVVTLRKALTAADVSHTQHQCFKSFTFFKDAIEREKIILLTPILSVKVADIMYSQAQPKLY